MKKNFCTWVCVDSKKVGTWKQAEALAERLVDGIYQKKSIDLPKWCRWMPPCVFAILPNFVQLKAVKDFSHSFPDLIIAAGRQAVLVAIALRQKAETVVLMNPGVSPDYFDIVVAPEHDRLTGKNVIITQGAIHGIEPSSLVFPEYLQRYHNPRVAVLLGGNSIHGVYKMDLAQNLANDLKKFCRGKVNLIITPSRRTPVAWLEVFEKSLDGLSYWIWDQKLKNPYPDMLCGVDAVIVCEDSISMASEACVTGKPVLVYSTNVKKNKFRYFYEQLFAKGYAIPFSADFDINKQTNIPVLKEIDHVAEQILKILKL